MAELYKKKGRSCGVLSRVCVDRILGLGRAQFSF